LVYALNALLLFNLTVIVVMLSGTVPATPPYAERSSQRGISAAEPEYRAASFGDVDRDDGATHPVPKADEPTIEPKQADEPKPIAAEAPTAVIKPAVHAKKVSSEPAVAAKQNESESKTIESAEQDDPPVMFFGIGLE